MRKTVEVTFTVAVELDETKFTPEFQQRFNNMISYFDTLDEHCEHIAWLAASERLELFTEGYGLIAEMGIKAEVTAAETEILS